MQQKTEDNITLEAIESRGNHHHPYTNASLAIRMVPQCKTPRSKQLNAKWLMSVLCSQSHDAKIDWNQRHVSENRTTMTNVLVLWKSDADWVHSVFPLMVQMAMRLVRIRLVPIFPVERVELSMVVGVWTRWAMHLPKAMLAIKASNLCQYVHSWMHWKSILTPMAAIFRPHPFAPFPHSCDWRRWQRQRRYSWPNVLVRAQYRSRCFDTLSSTYARRNDAVAESNTEYSSPANGTQIQRLTYLCRKNTNVSPT